MRRLHPQAPLVGVATGQRTPWRPSGHEVRARGGARLVDQDRDVPLIAPGCAGRPLLHGAPEQVRSRLAPARGAADDRRGDDPAGAGGGGAVESAAVAADACHQVRQAPRPLQLAVDARGEGVRLEAAAPGGDPPQRGIAPGQRLQVHDRLGPRVARRGPGPPERRLATLAAQHGGAPRTGEQAVAGRAPPVAPWERGHTAARASAAGTPSPSRTRSPTRRPDRPPSTQPSRTSGTVKTGLPGHWSRVWQSWRRKTNSSMIGHAPSQASPTAPAYSSIGQWSRTASHTSSRAAPGRRGAPTAPPPKDLPRAHAHGRPACWSAWSRGGPPRGPRGRCVSGRAAPARGRGRRAASRRARGPGGFSAAGGGCRDRVRPRPPGVCPRRRCPGIWRRRRSGARGGAGAIVRRHG